MSESIDRRVVEMRFDNKDFEQNVNTTMTVLDKLKDKLSFKGAEKGFEDISKSAKNTDFKGISGAVETVQAKFSALEVMAITALTNITNSAVNAGKRLVSAFTIDPIKTGFQEYETQINAVQTILANTSSKGTKLEDVNKALDELNHYADKTIYNFTEMTRNIGTFTAAGIDLDTSVNAIQGIANLAAVSGSNAQQASTAMYQLSQALASGTVKLQDWNSVVNAGMGGEVFQNALKETARLHGVAVDEMIKKNGSFRESLKEGWITSEILTETLKKFTVSGVNEYLAKNTDLSEKQIQKMRESADASEDWEKVYRDMAKTMAQNSDLTEDQIFEYLKMSKTAEDAATKVKTFSQLMDTLKEAAQSGWTQTWEILIGDFNEAKGLFTGISDVLSKFINSSSDARNKVLQEWKDLGGRDDVLSAFKNLFDALKSIIAPIHDAFRKVFPPTTAKQLQSISDRFEALSKRMIVSESTARKLRTVLVALFKVVKGGISIISGIFKVFLSFSKILVPIGKAVLDVLSDIISKINVMTMGHALNPGESEKTGVLGWLRALASLGDIVAKKLEKLMSGGLGKLGEFVGKIGVALGKLFSLIGKGLSHIDLGKVAALLAGGGIMSAGMKIAKLSDTISEKLENLFGKGGDSDEGLMAKVKNTLSTLSDTLDSFQTSVKVGQLVAIAISLGILAASCSTLANVPSDRLGASVAAIAALFGELAGATRLMKDSETKGIIAMSVAVYILAKSVQKMSEIESMGKGLLGVGVILGEMAAFCLIFDRLKIKPKALAKTGAGLILMAYAIRLLAKPVKELGAMDIGSLVKGLVAVGVMLGEFTLTALAFSHIDTKGLLKSGVAMVVMATAMRILAKPLTQLGGMDLKSLAKGLSAMGIALAELAGFTFVMGKIAASTGNILKVSAALLVMSIGISIMAGAINQMGMNSDAGKGLSVLFGALVILAGAMALMQNSLAGAAAMIIVAGALMIMAPAIAVLSSLNLGGVVTGLLALAGTLAIFGIGALLLAPVIPFMLALAAAMALLGVGVLTLGAGLTMLVTAFGMATGVIIDGAKAIGEALPIIAEGIGNAIVTIIKTIGDSAQAFEDTFFTLLDVILAVIYDATPDIVKAGMHMLVSLLEGIEANIKQITTLAISIITKFINALADGIPDLLAAGYNLIIKFLNSMADAISENGDRVANALVNVLLSALGSIVGLIPGFGKKAKAAIDEYRKGFEDKSTKGKLDKSAKKIATDTEKNMKVPSKYQDGKNVTKGFNEGLSSMIPDVQKTANKISDIVDKAIKKRNEIKSPSRRLYRTGTYLMRGLILGVDSLTGQYQKKADNIATTMVSSANRSVKEVSDIMADGFGSNFGLSSSIDRAVTVSMSMDGIKNQNAELASKLNRLTNSLDGMTETMNSRALNNYITVDGTADPEAFADDLIRSFRLNARTV